jgi:hypothetical protein
MKFVLSSGNIAKGASLLLGRYHILKAWTALFLTLLILGTLRLAMAQSPLQLQGKPLTLITRCLSDAIRRNSIEKNKGILRFHCYGDVAQSFYLELGSYGIPTASGDSPHLGKYLYRWLDSGDASGSWDKLPGSGGSCGEMIENPDGSPVGLFYCELIMKVGSFLER